MIWLLSVGILEKEPPEQKKKAPSKIPGRPLRLPYLCRMDLRSHFTAISGDTAYPSE